MATREAACRYVRMSDEGEPRTYSFCPECGSTVYYVLPSAPDLVAVPAGAFADPAFPEPRVSVWQRRKHGWVTSPARAERAS